MSEWKMKCAFCGDEIEKESGFKFSAYYDRYGLYWHIYCFIRWSYEIIKNPNAEKHTINEIIKLYS